MTPFDFVKSINEHKYSYDAFNDAAYSQFLINRAFSFFPDTIFHASEMNLYPLTNKMHYDYLFNSIKKRKRFKKWPKAKQKSEDIALIMSKYKYNTKKAKEALAMLSDDQIDQIRKEQEKGGT